MNKITKNFLSVSVSNILGQLFTFIIMVYYSGVLDTSNFGKVTLAQQILLYFTMIVLFGIQTYGQRIVSCNKDDIDNTVGELITFRFIVSIICFVAICLMALVINKDLSFKFIFVIFGLTLVPTALNIDWVFYGLQEMHHNAVYNLCKNIIPCILIFIFLKNKNDMYIIPISMIIGLFVGVFYQYYILFIKHNYKLRIRFNKVIFLKYAKYGMPFLLSGIFSMINNNADKIIMGFSRADSELGVYQAAYVFISFLINVIAIIFTPLFPLLIKYYHDNRKEELKKLCDSTSRLVAFIAVPIFIGGTILSKDIIHLYKKAYIQAYLPLSILLIYILILFVREIYGYQLNAWKLEKQYLKIIIVSSIANLVLNLILTPRYGMVVAAWITTLTELINLICMRRCAASVVKTKDISYIIHAFIPGAIMAIGIFGLKWLQVNVILIILAAIIIYFVFAIITKVIKVQELKAFIVKKEGV